MSAILASGGLAAAYNPVLLGYLLEEGKTKLPEAQRKKAIDQLVARFTEDMDVTPAEQLPIRKPTEWLADMDVPEGIDLLLTLLRDDSDEARTAAAYAFGRMKTPRAVEGLAAGLAADYGKDGGQLRSPEVKAHLLRTALRRFPRHAATKQMVESAGSSEFLSVRFLALAAGRIA